MIKALNLETNNYDALPIDIFSNDSYGLVQDEIGRTFSYTVEGEKLTYGLDTVFDALMKEPPSGSKLALSIAYTDKRESETYISFINRQTGLYKIMRITKNAETGITEFAYPNADEGANYVWGERENYEYKIIAE